MYIRYGNVILQQNSATVAITRQPLYDESNRQRGYREKWQLKGFLQADTQAALAR